MKDMQNPQGSKEIIGRNQIDIKSNIKRYVETPLHMVETMKSLREEL
jgi:hypothetical protein